MMNSKLLTSRAVDFSERKEAGCTQEQREILHFFKLPVRPQLTYRNADRLIEILFRNRSYAKRWDRYETEKFARQTWFRDNLIYANDVAAYFGSKALTIDRFKEVVHRLEKGGMLLKQIEEDYESLFQLALVLYPELRRAKRVL
jgi:hypothetical protein